MKRIIGFLMILLMAVASHTHAEGVSLSPVTGHPMAPDFELNDIDGKPYRLSALRGRVVIVNFWATWCPPCREEMPSMQSAWERLEPQGVVMLGINVGEDADTVFTFTGTSPVDFPLLLDIDGRVTDAWPLKGLPTTFVVDPEGRLAYRAIGGRTWDSEEMLRIILDLARRHRSDDQ